MQDAVNVNTPGGSAFLRNKLPAIPLDLNISFLQTIPGGFKIAHTALGMICLSVIAHYCQFFHPLTGSSLGVLCSKSDIFFLLVSYACFITSLLMLICSILSYFTASFLPKTAFEFAYHLVSCLMYLTSSLILLLGILVDNTDKGDFKEPGYEAKIAVSVLGLLTSVLYGISTYFSFESQKQMG